MMHLNYDDIVKKISEVSGKSLDDITNEIEAKLKKFSDLISKEGAAHILANELGVKIFEDVHKRKVPFGKLMPGMRNINVVGKVLKSYGVRSFKTEKREGKVGSFLAGDESGRIRIVMWDTNHIAEMENDTLKEDAVVRVENVYVKENNGFLEIHVGSASKVIVNPEGETVEVGEYQSAQRPITNDVKFIKDLQENDAVAIRGTVVQVFDPRFFQPKDSETMAPVLSVYIDDGTANIRAVAFRDQVSNILSMDNEKILAFKDNIGGFESVKKNLLGAQFTFAGRVKKNDMFDRLEFVVNRAEVLDAKKVVETLST